jgi:ABC-type transport system involved in cytochrome c biogenesis permease subunit
VSPLAFLLSLSSYIVFSGAQTLPDELQTAWLPAHVAPAFLGYAMFAVAFCVSLVYLLQERQVKTKRRGAFRLPSLETLDDLNYRCVAWGFALFTIGIVTGSLLAKAMWGTFWSWEPVQILSVLAWLLYALLLQTRSVGWRGRRAATLTIVGFGLLVVSFLSLNLGLPHGRSFG